MDKTKMDRLVIPCDTAVGAQMAWILRPFIGTPDLPFTLFRDRESNFFLGVTESIRQLFG